jgi:hypothetical protein
MENAFDRVNHDFLKVVLKKSCLINLLSLEWILVFLILG